jgi:hypothetical protein
VQMRPQLFLILAITLSVTGNEYGRRPPTEPESLLQVTSSATTPANDYNAPNTWLCRPGIKGACNADLTTTVVAANGALRRESWTSNPNAPIDCFYVYPTVSTDPTPNSDMNPDVAELNVIRQQFARFGSVCRLYAPMYRQVTLAGLRAMFVENRVVLNRGLGYDDVKDAWRHYLEHDNEGRGFVLIGHSQGSFVLTRLIQEEIDGKPVQSRLVSALLLGSDLAVPRGKDVGGIFQHVPLCHSASATGCVISYASFRSTCPRRQTRSLAKSQMPTWLRRALTRPRLVAAAANSTPISTRRAERSLWGKRQKSNRGSFPSGPSRRRGSAYQAC